LIVFDASTVVSAVLKVDSAPERALLRADEIDVFALSTPVDAEITGVLNRPKFAAAIRADRRAFVLNVVRRGCLIRTNRTRHRLPRSKRRQLP
jgi:predicted nucleic acid-binding protein